MTEQQVHFDPREILRTAMNTIHQQGPAGLLPAELAAIDNSADEVEALTRDRDETDEQAWHRAAIATRQILRSHSKSVVSEWIRAYAELPPMWIPPDLE